MIKIENAVFPHAEEWCAVMRGMRNPLNSWDKSDTVMHPEQKNGEFELGKRDLVLMQRLAKAGTDHAKFMRMLPVGADITAPMYWWKEFDTYKVGTVANSCSTMHKIHEKVFTLGDFSVEHLTDEDFFIRYDYSQYQNSALVCLANTIELLNALRDKYMCTKNKAYWWQMIQLLPSSYNQRRTVLLNYEVLRNIYFARKDHKLDEWRTFCEWAKESVPYFAKILQI